MKLIPLTKGKFAQVNNKDFPWLSMHKWHYHPKGYAVRAIYVNGKKKTIFMPNEIKGVEKGVDHRDGNGLNNQRYNLRLTTKSQNGANRPKQRNNTTGYKCVTRGKSNQKNPFASQIWHKRKRYCIGSFPKARWAAEAYHLTATHPDFHGKFAQTDFTSTELVGMS